MPAPNGTIPPEVAAAFAAHLFELDDPSGGLGVTTAQTVWRVPVILVGFTDQPISTSLYGSLTATQYFNRYPFDTTGTTATGSIYDYYRWVSGNRIRVIPKVVAAINLPNPKNYYANNNYGLSYNAPRNTYGFVSTALQYADSSVDWRPFDQNRDGYVDMLWVVHSGVPGEATVTRDNLWSLTSRLTSWPSGESFETRTSVPGAPTVHIRIDRFSVLPELSAVHPGQLTDIGVYCHEFGHALGLPDLYDTSTFGGAVNVGPGNWSLMATGGYGTDGNSPEYPAHMGAWPLLWLGWRDAIRPASDSLMVLGPLATGAPVLEFWFQGESNPEHFLIENRQRMSFDRNLPSEGLIVYQVDDNVMALGVPSNRVNAGATPGLRLVEADGLYDLVTGHNRGDERDPFPGYLGTTVFDDGTWPSTRSYRGAPTNIALRAIEPVGDNMRFQLQVRAAGWNSAAPMTQDAFNPVWPSGAANRAVSMADGSVIAAFSEPVAGRPEVVLRSRGRVDAWGPAVPVSASPSSATDPTLATLPGGSDLVVAWSDSRHGSNELYYRSRIRGVWSPERRLTDLPGDSRNPSLGVDRYGRIHLAWLYTEAASTQIRFMTFTYFSPFGMSLPVSGVTAVPDAPVVAVGPEGTSRIFWSDRSTSPASVWTALYRPIGGLDVPERVARSSFAQPAVDAVADAAGAIHVAWQVNGSGVNQIHYQRYDPSGGPTVLDTTIVSRGETVQSPVLRVGPDQGLHLAFVSVSGGLSQVRYKHRSPDRGWDYSSTEVTMLADGSAARPTLVAGLDQEVSVLYFLGVGGGIRPMERRRYSPVNILAAPAPPASPVYPALSARPNPLRAGSALSFRLPDRPPAPSGPGGLGDVLEIYDLAGRRVASAPLVDDIEGRRAEIPGSVTRGWGSGVYFARVRDRETLPTRLVVLR
jgi:immune inhibitor A